MSSPSSSKKDTQPLYLRAALLGVMSGMRSMSAPALVAREASQHPKHLKDTQLSFLTSTNVATTLGVAAVGELVGDKLPFVPDRTSLLPLAGRAASGALVGAATFMSGKQSPLLGACVGAAGAVASSFLFRNLRVTINKKLHIPDFIVALAEDSLVLALARNIFNL